MLNFKKNIKKNLKKILIFFLIFPIILIFFYKNFLFIKKENEPKIKITVWWDVMLSRMVWYLNQKEWFDRITKKYNPITQTGWIIFLNLESPFSKFPKDWKHSSFYFWAHTWSIKTLNDLKWKNNMIVSLANNHIKNSLKEWIDTTIETLKKNNIYFAWIWDKKEKANFFTSIFIENKRICFQAFTYDGWKVSYVYVNKVSKKEIKTSLDLMKKYNCDLNIISLHWGKEYVFNPTKKQVEIAHYTIDNWADIILWHHSHVFWKTEIYNKKIIFYSLGNYIFDQEPVVNTCSKYRHCIYDKKAKKKVVPVNIWVSYELIFQWRKIISKKQNKHRTKHYWELEKY